MNDWILPLITCIVFFSLGYLVAHVTDQPTPQPDTATLQDAVQAGYNTAMTQCARDYIAPILWECHDDIELVPVNCSSINQIGTDMYMRGWLP